MVSPSNQSSILLNESRFTQDQPQQQQQCQQRLELEKILIKLFEFFIQYLTICKILFILKKLNVKKYIYIFQILNFPKIHFRKFPNFRINFQFPENFEP